MQNSIGNFTRSDILVEARKMTATFLDEYMESRGTQEQNRLYTDYMGNLQPMIEGHLDTLKTLEHVNRAHLYAGKPRFVSRWEGMTGQVVAEYVYGSMLANRVTELPSETIEKMEVVVDRIRTFIRDCIEEYLNEF